MTSREVIQLLQTSFQIHIYRHKVVLIIKGELGAKSGRGFFDWPEGTHKEAVERRDKGLLEMVMWLRSAGHLANLRHF